jgi:lysosomal Pro-X carboxypeptidase
VFSNGNLDPWKAGGVTEYINLKLPYYIIQGGAHHLDLRLPNEADVGTDVFRVRAHAANDLQSWIEAYQAQFDKETIIMQ